MPPIQVLLGILVPIIWGGGFLFAKAAIEHFPPILLMALRFSLTALVLVWFVPRPSSRQLHWLFWIALVSAAIQYSLTFTGLKGLESSTAIIVVQLEVPFGILLAAIFLGDRLTVPHLVGMAMAFAGVFLIAGEPRLQGNMDSVLMVVGGALTWAVGQVMIKKVGALSGFTMIAWVAVFATPQLFISTWLFEGDQITAIRTAKPVVWMAVVYLGLVMTALGYAIWYGLIARYSVNQVMPFLMLLPVTTVVGGVLLLGDELTPRLIAGGLLAIGGVAIINTFYKAGNQ